MNFSQTEMALLGIVIEPTDYENLSELPSNNNQSTVTRNLSNEHSLYHIGELPHELTTVPNSAYPSIVAYSIIFVAAAIGNVFVLVSTWKGLQIRSKPMNRLLLHLSIADIEVVFMVAAVEVIWRLSIGWYIGDFASTTEWHANVFSGGNKEPVGDAGHGQTSNLEPEHSSPGPIQFPFCEEGVRDDSEHRKKPEDADCEIVTVTLLTTLLTYRAANKWHNRICKATVELLQELGFGENEGVVSGEDNSQSEAFGNGGQPKTTAEELDIAICRLLSDLNSKLERSAGKDGAEEFSAEDGGTEVMPTGSSHERDDQVVDADQDSENDEILTLVTEFVDGDEGGAKYFESMTSTVQRRCGSLMDGMTM